MVVGDWYVSHGGCDHGENVVNCDQRGDTPMICEVSTAKITGFKSLNKNHPGNLKIKQVFEIIKNSKLADLNFQISISLYMIKYTKNLL